MEKCRIVAEAGVNYDGSRTKMLLLCQAAKDAGADAIKFQAYNTFVLIERRSISDGQDRALLRKNELSDEDFHEIDGYCKSIKLDWFASVFSPPQVKRVLKLGACALKIGHAERDWTELRDACVKNGVPVYASSKDWQFPAHMGSSGEQVHWIKCTAEYPAKAPPRLREINKYGYSGFSSHYADYRVPAAAAMFEIDYLEAHLKLDDNCFEAPWSLSPSDFGAMVKLARQYESWL